MNNPEANFRSAYQLPPRLQRELKVGKRRRSFVDYIGLACLTLLAAIGYVTFMFMLIALFSSNGWAQDKDNCRGFISEKCCCTANWCRTISMTEVEKRDDGWYVVATNRKIPQAHQSQDGDVILCDGNGYTPYCLFLTGPNG